MAHGAGDPPSTPDQACSGEQALWVRSAHLGDDEWWEQYKLYNARHYGAARRPLYTQIRPKELDEGTERFAFIDGSVEWICAGGVILVSNPFQSWAMSHVYVPAVKVTAIGTETRSRTLTEYVRESTFDPNDEASLNECFGSYSSNHITVSQVVVGDHPTELPPDQIYWQSSAESCP